MRPCVVPPKGTPTLAPPAPPPPTTPLPLLPKSTAAAASAGSRAKWNDAAGAAAADADGQARYHPGFPAPGKGAAAGPLGAGVLTGAVAG